MPPRGKSRAPPDLRHSLSSQNPDFAEAIRAQLANTAETKYFKPLPGGTASLSWSTFLLPAGDLSAFPIATEIEKAPGLTDRSGRSALRWSNPKSPRNAPDAEECQKICSLRVLQTDRDGNDLVHAAALGAWGVHDRRPGAAAAASGGISRQSSFSQIGPLREMMSNLLGDEGFIELLIPRMIAEDARCSRPMATKKREAAMRAAAKLYADEAAKSGTPLSKTHVYVLAHVLRRPLVVLADPRPKKDTADVAGIYVPDLLPAGSGLTCTRRPVVLAHVAVGDSPPAFAACVGIEGETEFVALTDFVSGAPLPLRFVAEGAEVNSDGYWQLLEEKLAIERYKGSTFARLRGDGGAPMLEAVQKMRDMHASSMLARRGGVGSDANRRKRPAEADDTEPEESEPKPKRGRKQASVDPSKSSGAASANSSASATAACSKPPSTSSAANEAESGPPAVVRIDGATGDKVKYNGLYKRLDAEVHNSRPVWFMAQEHVYIGFTGWCWMVQDKESLGKGSGFIKTESCKSESPDLAPTWETYTGGSWQTLVGLTCTAAKLSELAPPPLLRLEAEVALDPAPAAALGEYQLTTEHSLKRPVWRHTVQPDLWLTTHGKAWFCQAMADLGTSRGVLSLKADADVTPDNHSLFSTSTWAAKHGSSWRSEPTLRCIALDEPPRPPAAVRLSGPLLVKEKKGFIPIREYLGDFKLIPGKLVNSKPVWQLMGQHEVFLASNGFCWMVSAPNSLGKSGWFSSKQQNVSSPDLVSDWEAGASSTGSGWQLQPGLQSSVIHPSELPAPLALEIHSRGGVDARQPSGANKAVLAHYTRAEGDEKVWRESSAGSCQIGLDTSGRSWCVLCAGKVVLRNDDATAPSPHLCVLEWKWESDGRPAAIGCVEGSQLPSAKHVALFEDGLALPHALRPGRGERLLDSVPLTLLANPSEHDVRQGQLGNCWLVSTIATFAAQPGAVQKLFWTRELAKEGQYKVQLFHPIAKAWQTIEMDDRLPVKPEKEVCLDYLRASPQHDIWPPLLEKAFAKLIGSYEKLQAGAGGGGTLTAMSMLTGCSAPGRLYSLLRDAHDQWKCWTPTMRSLGDNSLTGAPWPDTGGVGHEARAGADFHMLLTKMHDEGALLGCGSVQHLAGTDELTVAADGKSVLPEGIVLHHAYSILDVKHGVEGKFDLLKLRNPWGRTEWQGAWSDHSEMWVRYPEAKRALLSEVADDGVFWIAFEDWWPRFDSVHICRQKRDI